MNPFFPSAKPKPKKKAPASDSPEVDKPTVSINSVDALRTNPKDIGKAAVDQGTQAVTSAWEQLLGVKSYDNAKSGEMQPGVPVDFSKKEQQKPIALTEIHGDYVREIQGKNNQEGRESQQRIESLIMELRRLATSIKAVEKAVVLQAIGPSSKKMQGKYYENFFEWMLSVVQDARRKVEDSGAWLQTMTGKSKGKQAVGKMKHSMNQLLSGERTAQNQSG